MSDERLRTYLRQRWLRLSLALFLLLWLLPILALPLSSQLILLMLWQGLLLGAMALLGVRRLEAAWLRERERAAERQQQFNWLYSRLQPRRPLPAWEGSMAEPSLLVAAVEAVLARANPSVIELGSGFSTLVLAYALEAKGEGRLIALEDNACFAAVTRRLLAEHGLEQYATVIDAPLRPWELDDGAYRWYTLPVEEIEAPVDLLLVDGPAGGLAASIRYPALPALLEYLAQDAIILADDTDRRHERQNVVRWLQKTPQLAIDDELSAPSYTVLRIAKKESDSA
ncbi:MAG: class I SAM-dependent methyltransferase [Chloroflexi bacterium]|nr:class I SAM-dependent methyltransferase [Chloroflexota bacterium]